MPKLTTELVILSLTLASSIFTIVNVFTDWVPDTYALGTMLMLVLADVLWRKLITK